uniref:Uncharacterized protein n=1 Tax=Pyxicephalus adspersus TaxID=30357 RepID=A0AAV3AJN6_PYXAD|nr:TPA: hypothetical protein GDO54_007486 [Pyxicephalus adspersus]
MSKYLIAIEQQVYPEHVGPDAAKYNHKIKSFYLNFCYTSQGLEGFVHPGCRAAAGGPLSMHLPGFISSQRVAGKQAHKRAVCCLRIWSFCRDTDTPRHCRTDSATVEESTVIC